MPARSRVGSGVRDDHAEAGALHYRPQEVGGPEVGGGHRMVKLDEVLIGEEAHEKAAAGTQCTGELTEHHTDACRVEMNQRVPRQDAAHAGIVHVERVGAPELESDIREPRASVVDELGHRIDSRHLDTSLVQEARPLSRSASDVKDLPVDTVAPSLDQRLVRRRRGIDRPESGDVLTGTPCVRITHRLELHLTILRSDQARPVHLNSENPRPRLLKEHPAVNALTLLTDTATTLAALPALVSMDINIDPNSDGLPGIAQLRTIVGAVMTIGLILSVLALIISAIVWGFGANSSNPHLAGRGKVGVLVSCGAAVICGASVTLINFFWNVGQQV